MKKILFALLFVCGTASAQITQDSLNPKLLRYDTTIVIDLLPKFDLERKAQFMGFGYNLEIENLSLIWRIRYYKNGQPVQLFGKDYEDRVQVADQNTFVNLQGQVIDTTGHPGPFMRQFDFYKLVANRGVDCRVINQMVISAGMLPGRWKE